MISLVERKVWSKWAGTYGNAREPCPFLTKRSNPHEVKIEKIDQTRFMLALDVDSTYKKTNDWLLSYSLNISFELHCFFHNVNCCREKEEPWFVSKPQPKKSKNEVTDQFFNEYFWQKEVNAPFSGKKKQNSHFTSFCQKTFSRNLSVTSLFKFFFPDWQLKKIFSKPKKLSFDPGKPFQSKSQNS